MAEEETGFYLIVIVALVAIIGLGLSLASVVTDQSMGRMMYGGSGTPMMGGGGTSSGAAPGALEWTILVLSAAFLAASIILLLRARSARAGRAPVAASPVVGSLAQAPVPAGTVDVAPKPATVQQPGSTEARGLASPEPIPEPTLVRLLGADERRMYLEIRDRGGEILQRDLVALGIFSKAKVTRILDKLESKGIVVREAHGMTNRVRLVAKPGR